jgi:hypothetical protein
LPFILKFSSNKFTAVPDPVALFLTMPSFRLASSVTLMNLSIPWSYVANCLRGS